MSEDKYLSVGVMSRYIKKKFEVDPYLQRAFVKGEISNRKYVSKGHCYFNLVDDDAILSCSIWQSKMKDIPFDIEDGQHVLIDGNIDVFVKHGKYQFYVDKIHLDGYGNMFAQLKKDIEKLISNGYTDDKHKQRLPRFPMKIGIITSKTGAVINDMVKTFKDRYQLATLYHLDTQVQGVGSVENVIHHLKKIDAMNMDLVILARGGGSIEDLWTFNNLALAMQVFNMNTPIISAIGHESDHTLVDYVSDYVASTPTRAAIAAAPNQADVDALLADTHYTLLKAIHHVIDRKKNQLDRAHSYKLDHPHYLYQEQTAHLAQLEESLLRHIENKLREAHHTVQRTSQQFHFKTPEKTIREERRRINLLRDDMERVMKQSHLNRHRLLSKHLDMLNSLSPTQTMLRGYSITRKEDTIIRDVNAVSTGDRLTTLLNNGTIISEVKEVETNDEFPIV